MASLSAKKCVRFQPPLGRTEKAVLLNERGTPRNPALITHSSAPRSNLEAVSGALCRVNPAEHTPALILVWKHLRAKLLADLLNLKRADGNSTQYCGASQNYITDYTRTDTIQHTQQNQFLLGGSIFRQTCTKHKPARHTMIYTQRHHDKPLSVTFVSHSWPRAMMGCYMSIQQCLSWTLCWTQMVRKFVPINPKIPRTDLLSSPYT